MNSDSSFDFEPWDKQFTVDHEYLVVDNIEYYD